MTPATDDRRLTPQMLEKTVARLTASPRRAISFAQDGLAAGGAVTRQLRETVRRFDDVLADVHAMRDIAERLDARLASLQHQVDAFGGRIERVEHVTESVAGDVRKAADRLPDAEEGALSKLRSVLSSGGGSAAEPEGDHGAEPARP